MYTYNRPVVKEETEFTGYMIDEASAIKPFDYASVYRAKEFTETMKYFDTQDTLTRNILLAVNEADQPKGNGCAQGDNIHGGKHGHICGARFRKEKIDHAQDGHANGGQGINRPF